MPRNARSTWARTVSFGAWAFLGGLSGDEAVGQMAPPTWTVSDTPTLRIGETTGDDRYLFQTIGAAHFLPDGRVAVADVGMQEIRVFSETGEFESGMGGKGRGPGEFVSIHGMWVVEGTIAVWDAGIRRISTFAPDGELLTTARVFGDDRAGGNLEVFLGAFSNGDALLASLHNGPSMGRVAADPWVLERFARDGEFRSHLGHVRGMRRFDWNPIPFSPMPWVAVVRDSLYVTDGFYPEVSVRDESGAQARTIPVPRAGGVSPREAWGDLDGELQRREDELAFGQLYLNQLRQRMVPAPDSLPQVAGLLVDDRGRLWVKAYDPFSDSIWLKDHVAQPSPGGHWWIIGPDGAVLAQLALPEGVRPTEIRGDQILGVSVDDLGVERVVMHEVRR